MKPKIRIAKQESGEARAAHTRVAEPADSVETQISGFVRKYSPAIQKQLTLARKQLRALFPRGYELVFDNYNALVFGFSPTELTRDSFLSVAGYPKWVTLFFLNGAALKDPRGLLTGTGKQVRSIRLEDAADIRDAHVQKLIAQAIAPYAAPFSEASRLKTVIKSVVAKQRPRRPAAKGVP